MPSPNDFTDLEAVEQRLTSFEERYNEAVKPFKWKFTTTDLAELLDRLDRHQPTPVTGPSQPRAAWPPTNLRPRPLRWFRA